MIKLTGVASVWHSHRHPLQVTTGSRYFRGDFQQCLGCGRHRVKVSCLSLFHFQQLHLQVKTGLNRIKEMKLNNKP